MTFISIANGSHHTVIEASLGLNGIDAVWDDGNDNWEDVEDDPFDPIFLARKRQDDIDNNEKMPVEQITQQDATNAMSEGRARMEMVRLRVIQRTWRPSIQSLFAKIEHLNLCHMTCWKCIGLPTVDPKV